MKGIQHHAITCLELSLSLSLSLSPVTKGSATITTLKAHLKVELFYAAYDTV